MLQSGRGAGSFRRRTRRWQVSERSIAAHKPWQSRLLHEVYADAMHKSCDTPIRCARLASDGFIYLSASDAEHCVNESDWSTSPLVKVKFSNKTQQAYDWIYDRIVAFDYPPGYRLVQAAIADELGVSVVPVREALRKLEAEDLITFNPNTGAQVSMFRKADLFDAIQVVSFLEGAAMNLAAPHIGAVEIQAARTINDEMANCARTGQLRRFSELNRDFHKILFEKCPNGRLLDLLQTGWTRLAGYRESTSSMTLQDPNRSLREHETLLQLLEKSAPSDEIEKFARDHRIRYPDEFELIVH